MPMPVNLALEAASGVPVASSPWLFSFAREDPRYWLCRTFSSAPSRRSPPRRPEDTGHAEYSRVRNSKERQ